MCGVSVSCLDAWECMGVGLRVNVLDACMYVLIYVGVCVIVYALPRKHMWGRFADTAQLQAGETPTTPLGVSYLGFQVLWLGPLRPLSGY